VFANLQSYRKQSTFFVFSGALGNMAFAMSRHESTCGLVSNDWGWFITELASTEIFNGGESTRPFGLSRSLSERSSC
jgi:hypothetical protein